MPGFNTLPAVGGGGGQANMTFVASIHMNTYNRSWAQGGTPGYYAMYSTNQENGYAYFVGATTTGVPLNRLANISHSFTRIDVIAPVNDMVSLYKAKVKATTEFANAFANFSSFPSLITSSGNFVLPNNALPLVNAHVVGSGGAGGYHGGGGGGGGGVVKLTAYQAVGTTSCTIASGVQGNNQTNGNRTYFGNVYAIGGGGGGHYNHDGSGANTTGSIVANGGGAGSHGSHTGGTGTAQTASTGLGASGMPQFVGGYKGGNYTVNGGDWNSRGAGGGGAGGDSPNANGISSHHGPGHTSDISGSNYNYSSGGGGASHSTARDGHNAGTYGSGGQGHHSSPGHSNQGVVIVRYYIP